ncbi:PTS transporter subunit EIIC [Megamonas sp.]|mgnify:CR=1 FL=1|uniref:PTS transporter subunit EIIC n=2 Tax=Megamonas TaxID=158846 RepID=UPI00257CA5BB|nr:PTS transporter subunit EIIC [Megamonas sp.]MBS5780546.1 PTS sugar transporter subunit IIC [Megamonas sp.]
MTFNSFQNSKALQKLTYLSSCFGNQIYFRSLRDSLSSLNLIFITIGFILLINTFLNFLQINNNTIISIYIQKYLNIVTNYTINLSNIFIGLSFSYYLAKNKQMDNPIFITILTFISFNILLSNFNINENLGPQSILSTLIIDIIVIELYQIINKFKLHFNDNIPPAISSTLNNIIPIFFVIFIISLISLILNNILNLNIIVIINQFIQETIFNIFTSLWGCILIYSLGNFLWTLGIHQSVIYSSILEPFLLISILQNIHNYILSNIIPNIINIALVPTFGMIGGSGSTICLLLAIYLTSKNTNNKQLLSNSKIPSLFNINEMITFGYPIVYNPYMIIPFVLVPAIGIFISYMAISLNLMNNCIIYLPWITPPFLNAFLATAGDWRAIIVQIIIIIIGTIIYIPFIKLFEKNILYKNN